MRFNGVLVLVLSGPLIAGAQDRLRVQDAFGGATYEERTLANGLTLTVSYSGDGEISGFAITGVPLSEWRAAKAGGETARRPIDETQAREVLDLLYGHTPWRLKKLDLPVCGAAAMAPGRADSYQLGDVFVVFQYDDDDRLTSVIGLTGIVTADSATPPN